MKRLRRILLNLLTVMSLLLAIVTAGLWARSIYGSDGVSRSFDREMPNGRFMLARESLDCVVGSVVYFYSEVPDEVLESSLRPTQATSGQWTYHRQRSQPGLTLLRRVFPNEVIPLIAHRSPDTDIVWLVAVPIWEIVLLAALLPAARFLFQLWHRVRIATGRCLACGYDLRASPERCPECGMIASKSASATDDTNRHE